jgi:hypothetical protein
MSRSTAYKQKGTRSITVYDYNSADGSDALSKSTTCKHIVGWQCHEDNPNH